MYGSKSKSVASVPSWKFLLWYTVALISVTTIVVVGVCSGDDHEDELRDEVGRLKSELRSVMRERDCYKSECESAERQEGEGANRAGATGASSRSEDVKVSASGDCKISRDKSAIDDSPVVIISCESKEKYSYHDEARLVIRYKEGEKSVYVNFGEYLGSDSIDVTTRFDSMQAETTKWSLSTDRKAAFFGGDISRFVNSLSYSNKLVVRATPYSESPRTYTFDISNFRELVGPVRSYFN